MTTTEQQIASRDFMAVANRLPTLFDLEQDSYQLLAALETEEGSPDELEAQLVLVDQMLAEKTESYCSVIRSLESMAAARKVEADRLRDRAKTAEAHADWLKARLLSHLQATGRQRVEMSRFTLTLRQNPASCTVVNAALVPGEFQRTKIEISVDRRAILEHVKTTGEIPAGVEVTRGTRLEIR